MIDFEPSEQQAVTFPRCAKTRRMARASRLRSVGLLLLGAATLLILNLDLGVHAAPEQPKTPNSVQSSNSKFSSQSKESPDPRPNPASAGDKVKKSSALGVHGLYEDPRHNEILKQIQAKQLSRGKAGKTSEYGKIAKSPHVVPFGHEEEDIERLLKAAARPALPAWGFLPHRAGGTQRGAPDERRRLLKNELTYWQQGGMMGDQPMAEEGGDEDIGVMLDDERPLNTHHDRPSSQLVWGGTGGLSLQRASAKRSPGSSHLSLGISTEFQPSAHSAAFVGGSGGYGTAADGRRTTEDLKRSRPYDVPQIGKQSFLRNSA